MTKHAVFIAFTLHSKTSHIKLFLSLSLILLCNARAPSQLLPWLLYSSFFLLLSTCLPSSMTATTVPVPVNPCIHARKALMSKPLVAWYWPVLYCIEQHSGMYLDRRGYYITCNRLPHPWPLGVPQWIGWKREGPLAPLL